MRRLLRGHRSRRSTRRAGARPRAHAAGSRRRWTSASIPEQVGGVPKEYPVSASEGLEERSRTAGVGRVDPPAPALSCRCPLCLVRSTVPGSSSTASENPVTVPSSSCLPRGLGPPARGSFVPWSAIFLPPHVALRSAGTRAVETGRSYAQVRSLAYRCPRSGAERRSRHPWRRLRRPVRRSRTRWSTSARARHVAGRRRKFTGRRGRTSDRHRTLRLQDARRQRSNQSSVLDTFQPAEILGPNGYWQDEEWTSTARRNLILGAPDPRYDNVDQASCPAASVRLPGRPGTSMPLCFYIISYADPENLEQVGDPGRPACATRSAASSRVTTSGPAARSGSDRPGRFLYAGECGDGRPTGSRISSASRRARSCSRPDRPQPQRRPTDLLARRRRRRRLGGQRWWADGIDPGPVAVRRPKSSTTGRGPVPRRGR